MDCFVVFVVLLLLSMLWMVMNLDCDRFEKIEIIETLNHHSNQEQKCSIGNLFNVTSLYPSSPLMEFFYSILSNRCSIFFSWSSSSSSIDVWSPTTLFLIAFTEDFDHGDDDDDDDDDLHHRDNLVYYFPMMMLVLQFLYFLFRSSGI